MKKVILISGGAGFIGFNLIKYFVKTNLSNLNDLLIIVADNCLTGNKERLINYINNNNLHDTIHFHELDICKDDFNDFIMNNYHQIHEIYHLASIASPKYYKIFCIQTLDVGYIGTKNLLELAYHYKYNQSLNCKILLASTSEIYGDPNISPQNENYYGNVNTYGQRSNYDESKRIAETLFYTYNKNYLVDTRIVRIFNTYGPYMSLKDGRIVTETINALLTKNDLVIFGDGNQTRSLNYIDDTINMMINVMDKGNDQPINIGNTDEMSINSLVNIIQKVYNINFMDDKLNIIYTSIDKDDPKIRKPCLKKYIDLFGEIKYTSLEQGIFNTLDYFWKLYKYNT